MRPFSAAEAAAVSSILVRSDDHYALFFDSTRHGAVRHTGHGLAAWLWEVTTTETAEVKEKYR